MLKYVQWSVSALIILLLLVQCSDDTVTDEATENTDSDTTVDDNEDIDTISDNGEDYEASEDYEWDDTVANSITLNGTSITTDAEGVTVEGSIATITSAGSYSISGSLSDGEIIVDTEDEETVKLLFNGIQITSSSSAPIAILNAEKTVIKLAEGTTNYLTDTTEYVYANEDDDEPDAALFSDDDLTIYGEGQLIVEGNYNEAIKSKGELILNNTNIELTSVDDGIQGKDYLIIKGGTYNLEVSGDGLKASNDEDASLGYITIETGTFTIISEADGMQAETDVLLSGGDFTITSGGGSTAYLSEDDSAKGIKASTSVTVEETVTLNINAADDGLHSDATVVVNGGNITIASGDDAIHSDDVLQINGGDIEITTSVEGIEGAKITINEGTISVVASDDGVNAAGDADGSIYAMTINGGFLVVNASGDGLDANGSITMTDGVVLVNGPTANGNGALDYDTNFNISGGLLLAVGSASMVATPSNSSSQYSIFAKLNSTHTSGTFIHIEDDEGTALVSFSSEKSFQSIVFSSPELEQGASYKLYLGGSYDGGNATLGLYENGSYTPGSLYASFTVTNTVTNVN